MTSLNVKLTAVGHMCKWKLFMDFFATHFDLLKIWEVRDFHIVSGTLIRSRKHVWKISSVTKKHVCNGCNAVSIRAYCISGFALSLMRFLCWVGTTYTYTLCLLFLELTFRFRFQAGWFLTFLHLHFCRNLKCHKFKVSTLSNLLKSISKLLP